MPWKKGDVESHKKGLSDSQKDKWVRIANGALASCMKKGKKEEECAVSAIRMANSMVGHKANEETLNFNNDFLILADTKIRTEILDKRLHLVTSVVMLVEGVHNGLLYLEEDLKTIPESWNGRPIVVTHPKEGSEPISANSSPELAEKTRIGTIFNSKYENKKLIAEAWINIDKAMMIEPNILSSINNSVNLEVSTGLWFAQEEKEGDWNGEPYYAIARHYKPDHLAFLPNEKGACSWKDGCGVRANEEEIADGELSFMCIMDKMYQMMNIPSNPNDIYSQPNHRLKDIYSDYFTYENKEGLLYKQNYKVTKKGEIALKGEPEQVKKLVSYESLQEQERGLKPYETAQQKFNSQKTFIKESDVKKEQKIDYIIGTNQMGHDETKRPILEALSDTDLDWQYKMAERFRDCKSCNGEVTPDKTVVVNQKDEPIKPKTVQEYVKDAPPEVKDLITNGVRMHNERKTSLVKALIDNKRNKFSQEKLNSMPIDELESLISLAQIEPDFGGQGGVFKDVLKDNERKSDGSGVPDAPEMKWESAVNKNKARG